MRIRILWNRLPKALGESFSKMCHRPMRLASLLSMRFPLAAMGPTGAKLDILTGSLCTIGYHGLAQWAERTSPRQWPTGAMSHELLPGKRTRGDSTSSMDTTNRTEEATAAHRPSATPSPTRDGGSGPYLDLDGEVGREPQCLQQQQWRTARRRTKRPNERMSGGAARHKANWHARL
jgi:hypothetical protein